MQKSKFSSSARICPSNSLTPRPEFLAEDAPKFFNFFKLEVGQNVPDIMLNVEKIIKAPTKVDAAVFFKGFQDSKKAGKNPTDAVTTAFLIFFM